MSVALKAVAWAWRFTQTVKWLPGTLETGESQLPGTLDTGESQLPGIQGIQSTWESFYCLYDKNFVLILICELSIWNFHRF